MVAQAYQRFDKSVALAFVIAGVAVFNSMGWPINTASCMFRRLARQGEGTEGQYQLHWLPISRPDMSYPCHLSLVSKCWSPL